MARIDRTDRIHRINKEELDWYRMEQNRIDKYDVEPSMTYAYAYMTLHLHNQQIQEYRLWAYKSRYWEDRYQ
jgi:hypothetical protein